MPSRICTKKEKKNTKITEKAGAVYDLQGRKVNVDVHIHVNKGVYIVNGRKVVIK